MQWAAPRKVVLINQMRENKLNLVEENKAAENKVVAEATKEAEAKVVAEAKTQLKLLSQNTH